MDNPIDPLFWVKIKCAAIVLLAVIGFIWLFCHLANQP